MATDSLSYSGINRSITDYAGARACEELINLRPTTDGLVPVRPFTTKFANTIMAKMFVHHTTDGDHYIGIGRDTGNYKVYAHVLGTSLPYLFEKAFTSGTDSEKVAAMDRYIAGLSFAAAGNILLFSVLDAVDSIYENRAFIWKDEAYASTEANIPSVSMTLSDGETTARASATMTKLDEDSLPSEIVSAVKSAMNEIQEKNPDICLGPIVIAVAFKTKDGNTFWTDKWTIYDPVQKVNASASTDYVDGNSNLGDFTQLYEWFFDRYGHGYNVYGPMSGAFVDSIGVIGSRITLTFGQLDTDPEHSSYPNYWNPDTSIIQSIEVYASKPIPYLDTDNAYDGFEVLTAESGHSPQGCLILTQVKYNKMGIGSQQLYLQASVSLEDLAEADQVVRLKFGGNIQVTQDTLDVDAGTTTRYGKLLSYNSRFHYYDSIAEMSLGAPSFLDDAGGSSATHWVFVRYEGPKNGGLYYVGDATLHDTEEGGSSVVIAPSMYMTEIITVKSTSPYWVKTYKAEPSDAYNYSICDAGVYGSKTLTSTELQNSDYKTLHDAGVKIITTKEPAAINVTEQYNPFVFRVEHSYLAPGNILDLVPQSFVVTDATYGREPLDVFTESGIYALIQGSGDVLYSWFDPIDPMVAFGRAVPTEMGIFFLSGGCLYLCAGHRVTLVSDALMAGPHKYVRSAGPNSSYAKIAGSSGVVDMSNNVSAVEFETFARNGRLSYNRFRQEVIVSSASESYKYSYVLSLKYRQWFKVSERYWQDEPSGTLIFTRGVTSSRMNVLNMETETTGSIKIHLQTRPFSMGYQYAHIHRALSMIRAKLSGTANDVAVLHLYGSDDLQNWTLLAYAKRSGSTTGSGDSITDVPLYISQLRTPTAARSWRYYTVCLTGKVYAGMEDNTDIGPFIVDYEPVVRRIG